MPLAHRHQDSNERPDHRQKQQHWLAASYTLAADGRTNLAICVHRRASLRSTVSFVSMLIIVFGFVRRGVTLPIFLNSCMIKEPERGAAAAGRLLRSECLCQVRT